MFQPTVAPVCVTPDTDAPLITGAVVSGGAFTVNVAALLVTALTLFVTTTRYVLPESAKLVAGVV